jgi:hypothetical protein
MKQPLFDKIKRVRNMPDKLAYRNFRCPKYDSCLTAAAFQDLGLNCAACSLKSIQQKE